MSEQSPPPPPPLPLVSILMSSYNRAPTISRTIEAITAQTYPHWELIIVDDCSQDDSVKVIRPHCTRDPRIHLHRNPKNLGPFPTLNRAFAHSSGDLIAINDSDDIPRPDRLAIQTAHLAPDGGEPNTAAVASWSALRTPAGERVHPGTSRPTYTREALLLHLPIFNVIAHSTLMLTRALFEKIAPYPVTPRYSCDWIFVQKIITHTPLVIIPRTLVTRTAGEDTITARAAHRAPARSPFPPHIYTIATQRFAAHPPPHPTPLVLQRIYRWGYHTPAQHLLWHLRVLQCKTHLLVRYLRRPPPRTSRLRLIGAWIMYAYRQLLRLLRICP